VVKAGTAAIDDSTTSQKFAGIFRPGDAWNYSSPPTSSGYLIAKSAASRSSSSEETYLRPARHEHTDFYVPADKVHRFAACYSADPQGGMTFCHRSQGRHDAAG